MTSLSLLYATLALALTTGGHCASSFSFSPPVRAPPAVGARSPSSRHRASRRFGFDAASRLQRASGGVALRATSTRTNEAVDDGDGDVIGTVSLLVPSAPSGPSRFGSKSPVPPPSYAEAAEQLARKIRQFSDGRVVAAVVTPPENGSDDEDDACLASDALFALGITASADVRYLSRTFRRRRATQQQNTCQFAIDCGDNRYAPVVGPYDEANPSFAESIPWTEAASGKRLAVQMAELFDKQSTDEFALAVMLFFDRFSGQNVPWVQHSIDVTWEKGPYRNAKEIYSMITKCGPCITKCLADENCKACIDALDEIDTRDQVTSYRTVVSFESELLRDFSLCILQKNNIFGCHATIPKIPSVEPMSTWQGKEVTTNVARGIMIGHLEGAGESLEGSKQLDVSWKVTCGANVAYDQFPSQNQLFYPSAKGKGLWYDPVFRVETIDGRNVWCKRHYRVRNGRVPGTFHFSVLDNGVTSDEFWTIVGAADDLGWVVFHYAGAAGAVGQRYLGGLLCTADGQMPPPEELDEIWECLRAAEIEPWELFVVDNDATDPGAVAAGPPPLDFYRKTAAVIG